MHGVLLFHRIQPILVNERPVMQNDFLIFNISGTFTDPYLHAQSTFIYIKSTTVCPLVGIGTLPPPLSPASVPLPPEPKGGGHTRLRVRGWWSPNSDDWRKA